MNVGFHPSNYDGLMYVFTKLPETAMRSTDVEEVLSLSLEALGVDYLDMYLIHKPFGFDRTSDFDYVRHANGSAVIDMSTDLIAIWRVSCYKVTIKVIQYDKIDHNFSIFDRLTIFYKKREKNSTDNIGY